MPANSVLSRLSVFLPGEGGGGRTVGRSVGRSSVTLQILISFPGEVCSRKYHIYLTRPESQFYFISLIYLAWKSKKATKISSLMTCERKGEEANAI